VIKLAGTVTKAATTDSVTLEVAQTRTGEAIANPVFSLDRDPASTEPFVVDHDVSVQAGDRLEVRFKIDSPIDLTAIGFPPATLLHWQYASATNQDGLPVTVFDDAGQPLSIAVPFDIDTYGLRAPTIEQPTYVAPQSGTLRVFATVVEAPNTRVDFTIKRPGAFVAKRGFVMSGTVEVDVPVNQGDALFFDFSTREQSMALFTIVTEVRVTFDPDATSGALAPRLLHFRGPTERCPQLYRGWTYAGLNATKIPPGTPIPDDAFCHEPSSFDQNTQVPGDIDTVKNQGQQVNDDPAAFYDCMAFYPGGRRGLAVSDPVDGKFRILATHDFGRSWAVLPNDGMPEAPTEFGFAASGDCLVTAGNTAYLGSGGGAARVFRSDDHGLTWTATDSTIPPGDAAGVFALAFRTPNKGVAVGGDFADPATFDRWIDNVLGAKTASEVLS